MTKSQSFSVSSVPDPGCYDIRNTEAGSGNSSIVTIRADNNHNDLTTDGGHYLRGAAIRMTLIGRVVAALGGQ